MAHESFEDERTAALLNESFVSIKVDREERPDIDGIYMAAVQLLTGRGGWPMSVFLTPDREPFFAGTYWPPEPRHGMPGFRQVLAAVLEAWTARRESVATQAAEITQAVRRAAAPPASGDVVPGGPLLEEAASALARAFDPRHGGFGGPPKFPHPMDLRLLLRTAARAGRPDDVAMVTRSLECMAAGGIHDHLGGGFARYAVDDRWLVPHFEKMLYDNALLATAYLEGFLVTGRKEFAVVVRSTLDYVLRDMTDPAGGFWSAEDADSEGEEGKFYVWTPDEIRAVLGPEAAEAFCAAYDVTPRGNFEGRSILNLPQPLAAVAAAQGVEVADLARRLAAAREKLLAARGHRIRPGTDDKVLVAWNGLMIDALARAGATLAEPRYVAAAERAAGFLLADCRDAAGRLAHQWRRGRASGLSFAEDLACLAEGLVSLAEATLDERWIAEACKLADLLLDGFVDPESGAIFQTSPAHEQLLVRQPDLVDNATPGATGMTAAVLLRLAEFTGRDRFRAAAERALAAVAPLAARAPGAVPQALLALDWALGPVEEAVLVGDADSPVGREVLAVLRGRFRPRSVTALRPVATLSGPLDGLFAGRTGAADTVTLYLCRDHVCAAPAVGTAAVAAARG
jgi:uncharacterized protein YyaL (SSP411 family)